MNYRLRLTVAVLGMAAAFGVNARASQTGSDAPPPAYASAEVEIPNEMLARYAGAHWTYPSVTDARDFNPNIAALHDQEDRVTISCRVNVDGTLTACAVIADTNPKFGFGPATVAMFEAKCHVDPTSVAGGVQAGDVKKFTYVWQPG